MTKEEEDKLYDNLLKRLLKDYDLKRRKPASSPYDASARRVRRR